MAKYNWNKASITERKLWVTLLKNDGHSDEVIGDFFGKSKGTIVGFRHRELPELTFGAKATKQAVKSGRLSELLNELAPTKDSRGSSDVTTIVEVVTEKPLPTVELSEVLVQPIAENGSDVSALPTPTAPTMSPTAALPRRFIAEVIDTDTCRCPVPGRGLKQTARCRVGPVVFAGCCAKHATLSSAGNRRANMSSVA